MQAVVFTSRLCYGLIRSCKFNILDFTILADMAAATEDIWYFYS